MHLALTLIQAGKYETKQFGQLPGKTSPPTSFVLIYLVKGVTFQRGVMRLSPASLSLSSSSLSSSSLSLSPSLSMSPSSSSSSLSMSSLSSSSTSLLSFRSKPDLPNLKVQPEKVRGEEEKNLALFRLEPVSMPSRDSNRAATKTTPTGSTKDQLPVKSKSSSNPETCFQSGCCCCSQRCQTMNDTFTAVQRTQKS